MSGADSFEVFVSYARADLRSDQATRRSLPALVAEMRAQGLRVFFDTESLDDFAALNPSLDAAIRRSKAVLAWYSPTYPTRPACRAELTLALIAARSAKTGSMLMAINTEPGITHIRHAQVLGRNFLASPDSSDREAIAELARRIAAQVRRRPEPIERPHAETPQWYPSQVAGVPRFLGRLREIWELDARLWPELGPPSERALPGSVTNAVAVSGLAGIGKTVLVLEYAHMMASAFPGGIFWLPAGGRDEDATAEQLETRRESAFRAIAGAFGIRVEKLDLEAVMREVATRIAATGRACLWIVDDLPAGLDQSAVERWLGPIPARTVVTTRSQEYDFVANVRLDAMDADEALAMLTNGNAPADQCEEESATAIVRDVEAHPMALDLARAYLTQRPSYTDFLMKLRAPVSEKDILEEAQARSRQRSVELAMLASFSLLDEDGLAALRLACSAPPLPIPDSFLAAVAGRAKSDRNVERGIVALLHLSLARRIEPGVVQLHALVSRSGRRLEPEAVAALRPVMGGGLFDALHGIRFEDLRRVRHEVRLARGFASTLETPLDLWVNRVALTAETLAGAYQSSLPAWRDQVRAADRLSGAASWEAVRSRCHLSDLLRELSRFDESLAVAEEALYWSERNHGWTDAHTIHAAECVALALASLSRKEEAVAVFERVQAAYAALGPEGTSGVMRTMSNLSVLRPSEGLAQLLTDAVANADADEEALRTVIQLAPLELQRDRPAVAIRLLSQCLSRLRERVGDRHPLSCQCMVQLAEAHAALEQYPEAEKLLRTALAWYEDELGVDNATTVAARQKLVAVRQRSGDPEIRKAVDEAFAAEAEAARLFETGDQAAALAKAESALAKLQALLGASGPYVRNTLRNIAHIAFSVDLERCASAAYELNRLQSTDDLHRRETLKMMAIAASRVVAAARSRKDSAKASLWGARVLAAQDELHGRRSDEAVTAAWNLSQLLNEDGRRDEAMAILIDRVSHLLAADEVKLAPDLQLIREAAGVLTRDCRTRSGAAHNEAQLSEQELDRLTSRVNAAMDAANPWQVREELQQLADDHAARYGSFHPDTLRVNGMLWSAVGEMSTRVGDRPNLDRAIEELSLVSRAQRAQLGDTDPALLATLQNLAGCLSTVRPAEAARLDEQCLELARKLYGIEHPMTAAMAFNAVDSAGKTGNHTGARYVFHSYLEWFLRREPSTLPEALRGARARAVELGQRLGVHSQRQVAEV